MQIVRKVNADGHCIELGTLLRETRQFYVVDGSDPQKRIGKDNAHLKPCRRCKDYREPTRYAPKKSRPRGIRGSQRNASG